MYALIINAESNKMDIIDIAFNILFIGLFCMVTIVPYLIRKKARKILVDNMKNTW